LTQTKLQVCILQFISNKICPGNYVTFYGLVSEANGIFKTSTSYHNKTIIWISFPNPKIGMLTKEKSIHLYTNNIQLNETPIKLIIKDMRIGKNKSYILIIILISNSINNNNKNHSSITQIIIKQISF